MEEKLKVNFMNDRIRGPVEVVEVNREYSEELRHDLNLVIGKYESGRELERRLTEVNIMNVYPTQLIEEPEIFGRAWGLIGESLVKNIRKEALGWESPKEVIESDNKTGKETRIKVPEEERQRKIKEVNDMNEVELLRKYMSGNLGLRAFSVPARLDFDVGLLFKENNIPYTYNQVYEERRKLWAITGYISMFPICTPIAEVRKLDAFHRALRCVGNSLKRKVA